MKSEKLQAQQGMVLIEAMVALVVIAAGILGVAKLNTFFMEVSGQAKARTQAVQLAEGKLEELRSLMVRSQFTAIANGSDTAVGYSAANVQSTTFQRTWTSVNNGAEARALTVAVSWTDRAGIDQQVTVRSVVTWDDPGKAVALTTGTQTAGTLAQTPTGRAEIPDTTRTIDVTGITPTVDNLRLKQIDGKWHLTDANGRVLLVSTREDEPFSQIAGRVYFDQTAGSGRNPLSNLRNEDVYVVISDASYCSMTPVKNVNSPSSPLNYYSGDIYKYFSYRCYVGANWFGNIGVVRVDDNVPTNDRICLGDPAVGAVSASVKSDNRHPALGTSRMYRGYIGGSHKSTGIGVQTSDPNAYTPATYDGHNFLLTHISGNPVDADCRAKLMLFDATPPMYDPFSADAVTHTPATETAYLSGDAVVTLGNPGKFFCLTPTCPDPLPNAPAPQITINVTGTIVRSPATGQRPVLTALNTNSGSCTISGGSGSTNYTYSCSFTGMGFTGATWSGTIAATTAAGQYVCDTGTSGSAVPLPTPPTSPALNTYTFNFMNQSVAAGSSEFNFKIGSTVEDCLTTP